MKFQCDAVISDGGKWGSTVGIYDQDSNLVYTVDSTLILVKKKARAIVDWLNSLDEEAQKLAFCDDCEEPILVINWDESGRRVFDPQTGGFVESDARGYGEWLCGCGHPIAYEDLCKLGVFTEPEPEGDKTWSIWTLSEGDIVGVYEQEFSGVGDFPEYDDSLSDIMDTDEVARVFEKAVSNLLGEGYDWQMILRDAIQEVMKDEVRRP